jgi:hypothetical protein
VFLGHYALAFAAKKAAPRISLGTLFLAALAIWGAALGVAYMVARRADARATRAVDRIGKWAP